MTSQPNPARKLERPEVIWTLLDALARGDALADALRQAGVAPSTFYRECRRSELFRGLVDRARASAHGRAAAVPPPPPLTVLSTADVVLPVMAEPSPDLEDYSTDRMPALAADDAAVTIGTDVAAVTVAPDVPAEAASPSGEGPSRVRAFVVSLGTASRAGSANRTAIVAEERASESVAGADWALPAFVLVVQCFAVLLLVDNLAVQMASTAIVVVGVLALMRRRVPVRRARQQAVPVVVQVAAPAAVEARHNLDWLEASIAHSRVDPNEPGR